MIVLFHVLLPLVTTLAIPCERQSILRTPSTHVTGVSAQQNPKCFVAEYSEGKVFPQNQLDRRRTWLRLGYLCGQ